MKIALITVGKPRLAYARAGVEAYLGRMRGMVTWTTVKNGTQEEEACRLLAASEGWFRVLLDEHGKSLTSRQLADQWTAWEARAIPRLAFLIGGAEGHDATLKKAADATWSLSPLTLQHELAAVVVLEQIYRAHTLRTGHPYHRD
jgi:23S rRNA (pseudouridine1915-N3)-methyltransferase